MKDYTYTNNDLIKMQTRPFQTKLQVTIAKFIEFCQRTNYNVSISFSGGGRQFSFARYVCKILVS